MTLAEAKKVIEEVKRGWEEEVKKDVTKEEHYFIKGSIKTLEYVEELLKDIK